ncbi:MAG: hypothetical protein AB7I79_01860 [Rhizobiaceae bacterium]
MKQRLSRLAGLHDAQRRLQAVHEARHATLLAAAARAEAEVADLRARADADTSLARVFPELYSRHIAAALDRAAESRALAVQQAASVAEATLRSDRLADLARIARRDDERHADERTAQEIVEQRIGRPQ